MDRTQSFAAWSRELRESERYSQGGLARRMGYSQAAVSRVERGQGQLTADYVMAMARALDVDPREALTRAGLLDPPAVQMEPQKTTSPPPPEGIEIIERRLSRMTRPQREHYLRMFKAMLEAGEQGGEYDSAGDGN